MPDSTCIISHGVPLVEIWRGDFLECRHHGHAVICDAAGAVVAAWGDPDTVILPRSSCKMIQALPLVESGAADAAGLDPRHLALACASHEGAALHTEMVVAWLGGLGLGESDLACGPQVPADPNAHKRLICADDAPGPRHNNCSGKHAGFLTLARHIGAGPGYVDPEHPVQRAVRAAFEEVTGETSPGFGIDGCSAPNFGCTLAGLARAMAGFAAPAPGARGDAQRRLVAAMHLHPVLVAGQGRACTELMQAMRAPGVVKTGADGVYTGILPGPGPGLGIALKIEDGATRASECAIATLLAQLGAVEADHPAVRARSRAPIRDRNGRAVGEIRPAAALREGLPDQLAKSSLA